MPMKIPIATIARLLVVMMAVTIAIALSLRPGYASRGAQVSLPEGRGSEVAKSSCLACHGAEPIVQQRIPRAKWQAEVEKMERWGADVPSDKKSELLDYLTANFGSHLIIPPRKPGALPDGPGLEVVQQSCLSCHGSEPISQQRLTPSQWTAEVDKMVRWGAEIPTGQKPALIDYLSKNFPSKN